MTTPENTQTLSRSAQLAPIYQIIKTPLHLRAGVAVIDWKNETNSIGRRITCGFALAGLAIAGVIDMIAAAAIGIFTSPAELGGYEISRNGWKRLYYGGIASFTFVTIYQYENIIGRTVV